MPGASPPVARGERPYWSQVLRALREARGVTQEGWSALLGVSRTTVQRWESGRTPPDAFAEEAVVAFCEERGLFRAFEQGPLRGLELTEERLRDLLGEARLGGEAGTAALGEGAAEFDAAPLTAEPARAPRAPARGVFVGRDRALEQLRGALDDALAGRGSVVMLVGEPGIGKTRTLQELEAHALASDAQVLWGSAIESAGTPAYWPWVRVGRSHIATVGPETLKLELRGATGELSQLWPEILAVLPSLAEPAPRRDPVAAEFRLFDATAAFLRSMAEQAPVMIVLDDLHWADEPTLLMLQHIAREIGRSRILIAGSYRDTELSRTHPLSDALAELRRDPGFLRVPLRGLSRAEVDAYMRGTTDVRPSRDLLTRVFEETEGNPFFVAEVVDLLLREGALTADSPAEIAIPEGVREALGRRLNRLSERANRLCSLASVIGREFTHSTLALLHDEARDGELLPLLEEGIAARVIEETEEVGHYRFTHALMMETLLAEISRTRRVHLDGQVAEALERLYGDEQEQRAAELASHFGASATLTPGHARRAVHYSRLAAKQAEAQFARAEAARLYGQCLALMDAAGDDLGEDRAALLAARGRCLELRDAEGWRCLVKAVDLYGQRGDPAAQARVLISVDSADPGAHRTWEVGTGAGATYSDVADRVLAALGDTDPHLRAQLLIARASYIDDEAASRAADEAADLAAAHGFADVRGLILRRAAFVRSDPSSGMNRAMGRRHLEAHEALKAANLDSAAARALFTAVWDPINGGRLDEAAVLATRALGFGRAAGNSRAIYGSAMVLAEIALLRCDWERFDESIEDAPPTYREALTLRISRAEALGSLPQALDLLRHTESVPMAETHGVAARVLLKAGRMDEARHEFAAWINARRAVANRVGRAVADWIIEDALFAFADDSLLRAIDTEGPAPWPRGDEPETKDDRTVLGGFTGHSWDRQVGLRELRLGHVDSADERIRAGIEWAERERCPILLGRLHQALVEVALARGDHAVATQHLDAAGELFNQHGAELYLDQVLAKQESLKA